MTRLAFIPLAAALGACGASGQAAPVVHFNDEWPARAGDYETVVEQWTRSGHIVEDYDRVLDVEATFLSPAWRAAYVDKRAKAELMGDEARSVLVAEQKAAASESYEVQLLVATYRHEENDLQKGDRSMWRVALVDDAGTEILPAEIESDRRPFEVIHSYFPRATERHEVYVARFPRSVELMRPGAGKFSLRIASARGGVELTWTAR